ncbi:hypothetical protein BJY04DRAFT_169556 [Aspergillus karnatakaensis]|uniref:uncharacterized protein n=1 Tax=Aspergillus karnatakaensis TaxID=1810916 RepID=UPI003CCE4EC5
MHKACRVPFRSDSYDRTFSHQPCRTSVLGSIAKIYFSRPLGLIPPLYASSAVDRKLVDVICYEYSCLLSSDSQGKITTTVFRPYPDIFQRQALSVQTEGHGQNERPDGRIASNLGAAAGRKHRGISRREYSIESARNSRSPCIPASSRRIMAN